MAQNPFIGQICMFGANFAPRSWALCDGQILLISQNTALFSLLGTLYGGDGRNTFALPDLRGRLPRHQGTGPGLTPRQIGKKDGIEDVVLNPAQMPTHTHQLDGTTEQADAEAPGGGGDPTGKVLADATISIYSAQTPDLNFDASAVSDTGGDQDHSTLMPVLCVNFIIALQGVVPSRN